MVVSSTRPTRGPATLAGAVLILGALGMQAAPAAAAPADATAAPATAASISAAAAVTPADMGGRILTDTNAIRAAAGLQPLRYNPQLDVIAVSWANHQAAVGAMSHNPSLAAQLPAGWTLGGENVAWGYSYATVVGHWAASPEHYANLVGSFTDVGIGIGYSASGVPFYTQVLARF